MKKIIFAAAIVAMMCAGNVVYAQTPSKKADVKKEQTVTKKATAKSKKSKKSEKVAATTATTATTTAAKKTAKAK